MSSRKARSSPVRSPRSPWLSIADPVIPTIDGRPWTSPVFFAAAMMEALTGKLEGGTPVTSVTVGSRAPGEVIEVQLADRTVQATLTAAPN